MTLARLPRAGWLIPMLLAGCVAGGPFASAPETEHTLQVSRPSAAPAAGASPTATPSAGAVVAASSAAPQPGGAFTPTPRPSVAQSSPLPARMSGDRPDDVQANQIHLVYVLPADGTDENLDADGTIAEAARRMNTWLGDRLGGSALRFDTYKGEPDVTFLRLAATEAQVLAAGDPINVIRNELAASGLNQTFKVYAAFYGGSAKPGGAQGHGGNGYAAVYLKNDTGYTFRPRFGPSAFEALMLHEIVHALGFVGACAPHYVANDHVDDGRDLMAASWNRSLENLVLDPDHDDYVMLDRTDCPDLARSPFLDPAPIGAAGSGGFSSTGTVVP